MPSPLSTPVPVGRPWITRTSWTTRNARATALSLCAVLLLALPLVGCGTKPQAPTDGHLKIAASPTPHAEILRYVATELAPAAGLDLEIVEMTDYVQPNQALADGSVDANYFQHRPYLDEQSAAAGFQFTALTPVHLEPLGLYSRSAKSPRELKEGAKVIIPNDPSNGGRALRLLADQQLITLQDPSSQTATVLDIADNPKKLSITEVEAAQAARSLDDADAAVINGNYALSAGLKPGQQSIALEKAEENPYANLLVVREGDKDNPALKKLAELLRSPQVKAFIDQKYAGSVVVAP